MSVCLHFSLSAQHFYCKLFYASTSEGENYSKLQSHGLSVSLPYAPNSKMMHLKERKGKKRKSIYVAPFTYYTCIVSKRSFVLFLH